MGGARVNSPFLFAVVLGLVFFVLLFQSCTKWWGWELTLYLLRKCIPSFCPQGEAKNRHRAVKYSRVGGRREERTFNNEKRLHVNNII